MASNAETMRAVEATGDGELRVVDRPVPEPGSTEVRITIDACGVCGGDRATVEGSPAIEYPRIPGHEIAGRIEALGERVTNWEPGERVAVCWHGGHCSTCHACRRGAFGRCEERAITGASHDGGYAERAVVPRESLVSVPDDLPQTAVAPLACAGLTAFTALRDAPIVPGDTVAVQGIGGVGHMGIAYADAMGFDVVALSTSPAKREAAVELGADAFVDSSSADPADALADRGGADLVLGTAPSADAIESVVGGLAGGGQVRVVAAPHESVEISVGAMLNGRNAVQGWYAGHPGDCEDALAFAAQQEISPRVERYALADAADAHRAMLDGDARFRAVLEP